MTTRDQLLLRSPDGALAATPHLLGFTPHDSVVIMGLTAGTGTTQQLVLTQRMDRPSLHDLTAGQVTDLARETARVMADQAGADAVIVSVWGHQSPTAGERPLPESAFIDELIDELEDRDVTTLDVLYTDTTRRWSYGCQDPACCNPAGVIISEQTKTLMAAEFAFEGRATAGSRADMEHELDPVPDPVVAGLLEQDPPTPASPPATDPATIRADRLQWREQQVTGLHAATGIGALSAQQVADTIRALADIHVRDTYLWDLNQAGADRAGAVSALAQVARRAPAGQVAPAATVLALQHYLSGDGARANIALDRAQGDDPDYSLAQLARMSLSSGLPPATFAQAMTALTRDICLDPMAAPAAPTTTGPHRTTPPQSIAL